MDPFLASIQSCVHDTSVLISTNAREPFNSFISLLKSGVWGWEERVEQILYFTEEDAQIANQHMERWNIINC